jgi:two-component system, NtrC family, sensor kinase
MHVLIAEDDSVSRRLLRGHLERWGHQVTEARDGAEAWETFLRGESIVPGGFRIVVIDWMMPLMDGLELVQRIRSRHVPRYTYLLMLTAKNQKDDVVTGMDAGADDYLTKPFDKEELRARLQAGQRILDLQSALMAAEKSASVGRLAMGVAAEIAAPVSEILAAVGELRQESMALVDATNPDALPEISHDDPDAPPRPRRVDIDIAAVRRTLGPRFVEAERKLHSVRDLIRNLRDFARLDDVPTRALQLPALITETLSMMRIELTNRQLGVNWAEPTDTPVVTGNAGKLKRAFYNLLGSLVETTEPGGTLSLTLRREPGTVHLELTGGPPGLPADAAKHAFEPFARTGLQSGLGLPIAFSVIREHGGTLEADTPHDALRFTLKLPTSG